MLKNLKMLEWLIGQWEGIHEAGNYHESWEKINDHEFKGRAYMLIKGEIKDVENLELHFIGNEIYYAAEVSHNPAPVSFRMTNYHDTLFTFENPTHDFPQKITYEKKEPDSLIATIEGLKKNEMSRIEFNLKKVN